jgi:hypothetical protein
MESFRRKLWYLIPAIYFLAMSLYLVTMYPPDQAKIQAECDRREYEINKPKVPGGRTTLVGVLCVIPDPKLAGDFWQIPYRMIDNDWGESMYFLIYFTQSLGAGALLYLLINLKSEKFR